MNVRSPSENKMVHVDRNMFVLLCAHACVCQRGKSEGTPKYEILRKKNRLPANKKELFIATRHIIRALVHVKKSNSLPGESPSQYISKG